MGGGGHSVGAPSSYQGGGQSMGGGGQPAAQGAPGWLAGAILGSNPRGGWAPTLERPCSPNLPPIDGGQSSRAGGAPTLERPGVGSPYHWGQTPPWSASLPVRTWRLPEAVDRLQFRTCTLEGGAARQEGRHPGPPVNRPPYFPSLTKRRPVDPPCPPAPAGFRTCPWHPAAPCPCCLPWTARPPGEGDKS